MFREIERKFLLKKNHFNEADIIRLELISQIYVPVKDKNFRIRSITNTYNHETKYFLTYKQDYMKIIEVEINNEIFSILVKLPKYILYKTRYIIHHDNKEWKIDNIKLNNNSILYIAKIKLNKINDKIIFPLFIKRNIIREVTDEGEYMNYNLAMENGLF